MCLGTWLAIGMLLFAGLRQAYWQSIAPRLAKTEKEKENAEMKAHDGLWAICLVIGLVLVVLCE